MDALVQLDELHVTVIVDNETDGLSPPCGCCDPVSSSAATTSPLAATYTSEVSHIVSEVRAGTAPDLDFTRVCNAGHGYSLLLEAHAGGAVHRLLFDGGPSCDLLRRNAASLGLSLGNVDAAVLSHWHIDHSVGLVAAAEEISQARCQSPTAEGAAAAGSRSRPAAVFDLHTKRPHRRGLLLHDRVIQFNLEPELAAMQLPGIDVQLQDTEHTLADGAFYVSGHIPRLTPYEQGNLNHTSQWEPGGEWQRDEEIADERYVAAAIRGRGIAVFSACSHAGIVNVMKDVQHKSGRPPYAVFGGFHLAPRDTMDRIAPTVADMAAMQPALVVGGHCTGWRAKAALSAALGPHYMPSFVGSRFSIPAVDRDG